MQLQVIQIGEHGLISIWHEGTGIGKRGSAYDAKEKGYIELDPASKKLKIKRGWTNNAYVFDVDGWSGRYGMPLEFLLSVHIATQMPDLSIEMATTFDTDVEVLLRSVNDGTITAGVLKQGATKGSTQDSDYITWKQLKDIGIADNNIFQNIWNGISGAIEWLGFWKSSDHEILTLDDKACYELFDLGMPHSLGCTCCEDIPGNKSKDDCEGKTPVEFTGKGELKDNKHTICKSCKDRVTRIAAALAVVNDNTWESYTPYISKVTNHWFRDVYFVINSDESGDHAADERAGINAVEVDEEYFYETGERWTLYETYQEGDTIPEGFSVGDYKLYEYDASKGTGNGWTNGYKLFTGSMEEVEERKNKISDGDTSVSRLIKKPTTTHFDEYNVYQEGKVSMDWVQMEVSDESDTKGELLDPLIYEKEDINSDMLIYYKEVRPGDVVQKEDGIRAETNSKIKEMFINKAYYKYDGTVGRADEIYKDRQETDREKDNTADDERDEKLISKVSLTKDSLGAFSMLENTHTLDADYVYRDFKELIVELDYFDKEELSDKIDEVMQWIIPDCGSGGWPIRKYEKGETFYGTLINSKVDIKLMKSKDIEAAKKLLEELKEEVDSDEATPTTGSSVVPSGSVTTLVQTGYDVHKEMEGNKWDYCVIRPDDGCDHVNGNSCGLDSTIQEAIAGHHNTCCATFVSWVLKEAGFDLSSHTNMHGAQATYNWCEASGWTPITDYSALEPGDLLFNNGSDVSDVGHVQMLGNNGEWLNAGSVSAIDKAPHAYQADFIIGMRSNMNGAAKEFEGYEPNQDVVSPVTGKITEYGEVTRKNEETGEEETVEFIKIQAMNQCLYDTDGAPREQGKGYVAAVNADGTYNEFDPDNGSTLEGYDYFYEEYKGVIDGFVMYIEGFDLTLFDADGAKALYESGEKDSTKVTRYKSNKVNNMTDNSQEAYALWKEDAKTYAAPIQEINGELYIKEGTVIGRTYEDSEITDDTNATKGNGNYIRVILRDLEDSIVEDVETYFDIDRTGIVSQSQPYQAQEGDLELLAALICHEGGAPYWMNNHSFTEDRAMAAAEAVGYVCINRALTNYGGHGTTIRDQIMAPGQYADCEILENYDYCEKCLEAAEWCLTYDCNSITNPEGEPMTRDVQGQSGWEQCKVEGNCWWWIDTTGDGARTEYVSKNKPWDTFFCHNGSEG